MANVTLLQPSVQTDIKVAINDDPLPPVPLKKLRLFQRYNIQSAIALSGFVVVGTFGLILTIRSELAKDEASDVWDTIGSLLSGGGFSCIFIAIWQLMNSKEYAYRALKWFGLFGSVAVCAIGLLLQYLLGKDPPSIEATIGSLMLSQAIGPCITTLLLLEPKEKETLAMPYVNNFCKFVSDELAKQNQLLVIIVPSHYSLCTAIQERLREYKAHGLFGEEQLQCGAFKKFSTSTRCFVVDNDNSSAAKFYFDIPTFLSNATPRKLKLFKETLKAYLKRLKAKGQQKNVIVVTASNLTLKDIDKALLNARHHRETKKH